jgi:hypothetical protein
MVSQSPLLYAAHRMMNDSRRVSLLLQLLLQLRVQLRHPVSTETMPAQNFL